MNLAVFCSGNGSNFEAICRAVQNKRLRARLALLVCDNPKAFAWKRAAKYDVAVFVLSPRLFKTRKDYEKIIVRVLKSQDITAVALAGYMRVFSPVFIKAYRGRILNVHPAFLPDFKGAHAIRDAFEAGAKETGVTVHLVTEDVDAGPILAQEKVKISRKDTLTSLEKKIRAVEHRLYPAVIQKFIRQLKS